MNGPIRMNEWIREEVELSPEVIITVTISLILFSHFRPAETRRCRWTVHPRSFQRGTMNIYKGFLDLVFREPVWLNGGTGEGRSVMGNLWRDFCQTHLLDNISSLLYHPARLLDYSYCVLVFQDWFIFINHPPASYVLIPTQILTRRVPESVSHLHRT